MNLISLALFYARYRYIAFRLFLRLRMGKNARDDYLKHKKLTVFDFLPEIAYNVNGINVVLRKGTHDHLMFLQGRQWTMEQYVKAQMIMNKNEVFVDVGANVGSHSLRIAHDYAHIAVRVVAIEAEPETYKALVRNIKRNNLTNINAIKIAASDHKGLVILHERSYDGTRVGTGLHSILKDVDDGNFSQHNGKSLQIECDTLDNIISSHRADVMKIDIGGAEILALKGATNVLRQLRKIIVEIHGENLEKVKEILESNNFILEISPAGQYVTGLKSDVPPIPSSHHPEWKKGNIYDNAK
ncbi:MAG: FkbM family methyltransferase [Thermoproteota archaeon]|nr:FkbM family methyltransferase [Thermoproteota archaeon]